VGAEDSMGKTAPVHSLNLEQFLATIYVNPAARARFLASPEAEASRAGLSEQQSSTKPKHAGAMHHSGSSGVNSLHDQARRGLGAKSLNRLDILQLGKKGPSYSNMVG
jgi:hypothetical protein